MQKGANIDINSPLVPKITVGQAKKEGFKPKVNDPKVATKPKDMPKHGFINKY